MYKRGGRIFAVRGEKMQKWREDLGYMDGRRENHVLESMVEERV
jgi:hypothetical protein